MNEFVTMPVGSIPAAWLTPGKGDGKNPATGGGTLCIFGSRTLTGQKLMALIKAEIASRAPAMIVTAGEPKGVCEAAQQAAEDLAIPLKLHFLNFRERARGSFEHRSKACLREATHAIFIHDGKSKGTRNELAMAVKMHKPHSYYVLTATGDFKYVAQGGRFRIDQPAARR